MIAGVRNCLRILKLLKIVRLYSIERLFEEDDYERAFARGSKIPSTRELSELLSE